MKKIVILGGGYGGLEIVSNLIEKKTIKDTEIILVDKNPYHSMKTEFYALAAGTIADKHIRMSFPKHENVRLICDTVTKIDVEKEEVRLEKSGIINYDYLVIGLGCEDNYHNIIGAKKYTQSVQTINKARKTFESLNNVKAYGTVTIVGAGLTGVELASELRESREDINIKLFDRGETILPAMPRKLSNYITDWFLEHDVEVLHHSNVEYLEKGSVCNNGHCSLSDVTVWSAGIRPNKIVRDMNVEKDSYGRLLVDDYHFLTGSKHVFVVGDCASIPYPPSAQVARQQGKQISENLYKILIGQEPCKSKKIVVKGTLGSLGKTQGFGTMFGKVPMTGAVPRLLKSGVLWIHKFNH